MKYRFFSLKKLKSKGNMKYTVSNDHQSLVSVCEITLKTFHRRTQS